MVLSVAGPASRVHQETVGVGPQDCLRRQNPPRQVRRHQLEVPHIPRINPLGVNFSRACQKESVGDCAAGEVEFGHPLRGFENLLGRQRNATESRSDTFENQKGLLPKKPVRRRHSGQVGIHFRQRVSRTGCIQRL